MLRLRLFAAIVSLCFVFSNTGFAVEPSAEDEVPTVLFLSVADDEEGRVWESGFISELELSLDSARLKALTPETEEPFHSMAVDEQVTEIRPLLEGNDASAAIWVTRREQNTTLHVVVISKGRALVRLVEATPETSESHLASAARELSLTSHLFESSGARPNWGISILGTIRGGLGSYEGPSTWAGGTIGLERRLTEGLYARFWLGAVGGPLGSVQGLEASGFALQGGIGAAYLWHLGPLSLGPALGLQSEWSNIGLRAGSGPEERSAEWLAQGLANLELRFHVSSSIDIAAGGGVLFTPHQDIYRRESDNIVVFSTPFVSWNAFLGMIFLID